MPTPFRRHNHEQVATIKNRIPWQKLVRDTAVVVGSVYIAIVLEGVSDTRARRADAEQALVRLETELQQDRSDLVEILAAQKDRQLRHGRIERWLSASLDIPGDSLSADLTALFSVNRTMFPRNSSWTTMVSSGQLTYLDDPALVARLANLYENLNERLEYNGAVYDEWVSDVARTAVPEVWDRVEGRMLTADAREVAKFRGSLLGLLDLSVGFFVLLEDWGGELDTVLAEVERHRNR